MNNLVQTEKRNLDTKDIDISSSLEIAKMINNEDKKVADAIEVELNKIATVIDLANDAFRSGGRLLYFGAGTSGRLGVLDASEIYPTFSEINLIKGFIAGGDIALRNPVEGAEDNEELGVEDLILKANANENDIIVTISASGNPKYLTSIVSKAKEIGAKTVAITCNPTAKIGDLSDIFICAEVGPEVITGSSRMKAGTSQKMILNMISTGALVKYGKTYGNLMVDVKALNSKLIDRSCRIVSDIAGCSFEKAKEILEKTNYKVKVSIVMIVKNCDEEEAKELLIENSDILRKVIG